ncbi:MAG: sugar kinase [Terriglobia bacterium]
MSDVITFGEAMIRLSPPGFQRLEQTHSLDIQVGGGELNVAVAVSRLGLSSAWVSRLPDNPLGRMIRNKAREHGVDTSHIVWSKDGRAGLYFVEFGASPRASSVLYDRANSAISQIKPGEIDWVKVFAGAKWFHVSGITPALGPTAAAMTAEALRAAKKAGLQTSYDLNYRSKLWTDKEAQACQEPMMQDVDVLITTEEDTKVVFKITAGGAQDDQFAKVSAESYKTVAQKLQEKFHFKVVAITLRSNPSVWKNHWTAIAYSDNRFYETKTYEVEIVDRVGAGDSFSGGFIYGYLSSQSLEIAVQAGVAYSAIKHSNPGDFNWATRSELEGVLKGGGLRVAR